MPILLPLLVAAALSTGASPAAPPAPAAAPLAAVADTLRGRVTDAEGGPVEGADVQLPELRRAARTAGDGSFAFADAPPGSYTLVVRPG